MDFFGIVVLIVCVKNSLFFYIVVINVRIELLMLKLLEGGKL